LSPTLRLARELSYDSSSLKGIIGKLNVCDKDESGVSQIDAFARHTSLRQTGSGMGERF